MSKIKRYIEHQEEQMFQDLFSAAERAKNAIESFLSDMPGDIGETEFVLAYENLSEIIAKIKRP